MAHKHDKTRARKQALSVLYTAEIQGVPAAEVLSDERCLSEDGPLGDYAVWLVEGVSENLAGIDARLACVSENWALGRMPVVDRCILRLAVFEMDAEEGAPVAVVINEAVELAKDFGGEDESHRFVNGILGRISRGAEGMLPLFDGGTSAAHVPASAPEDPVAELTELLEPAAKRADEDGE